MKPQDLECWRCSAEGKNFPLPSHPDGGGTICHECHTRIYSAPNRLQREANRIADHAFGVVCDDSFTVGETLTILNSVKRQLEGLIHDTEDAVRRQNDVKPNTQGA